MEKFQDLKVWQKTHQLVLDVYHLTRGFPDAEKFGLVSQMRRAAVSVAANIVEGTKRKTIADRCHFHVMAETSLEELKYYFILGTDLKFVPSSETQNFLSASREIGAMLNALNQALKKKSSTAYG